MDINVVAENLAELLTNSVNMTQVYYDLFFNPEPMDITLYQYDDDKLPKEESDAKSKALISKALFKKIGLYLMISLAMITVINK